MVATKWPDNRPTEANMTVAVRRQVEVHIVRLAAAEEKLPEACMVPEGCMVSAG
jgi:hypothetical protein